MKKSFLSMLMIASCFGVANAQLTVDVNGKVGVGIETYNELNSQLSVIRQGGQFIVYKDPDFLN